MLNVNCYKSGHRHNSNIDRRRRWRRNRIRPLSRRRRRRNVARVRVPCVREQIAMRSLDDVRRLQIVSQSVTQS